MQSLVEVMGSVGQTMRRQFWYGDEKTNAAGFTGMAARYNTKTVSSSASNAVNVLDAGGGGDAAPNLQSAWLLTTGNNTLHGIFPKGSASGGLQVTPSDGTPVVSETFLDAAGNAGKMRVLRSWYQWEMGVALRDWRYCARVCNISVLKGGTNTKSVYDKAGGGTNYLTSLDALLVAMISAGERLPSIDGMGGKTRWFVSKQVREALRFAILAKLTSNLTWETVEGRRVMMFDGIEVVRDDALSGFDADGTTQLEPLVS